MAAALAALQPWAVWMQEQPAADLPASLAEDVRSLLAALAAEAGGASDAAERCRGALEQFEPALDALRCLQGPLRARHCPPPKPTPL